ncbi:MAG: 4Fe-4S binding protein [Thermodesulfovibrionales bacterium]|nr:4Fe-4S binding protein [Thermodesulfovibrionales bacterium]
MCEFCSKHGEGKIWYRNASNYSEDLLSDLRRRKFIENFLEKTVKEGFENLSRLESIIQKKGNLPERITFKMLEKAKEEHYGQVIPIEEVKEILDKTIDIVRLPCACRWTIDRSDIRCCYGITYHPHAWYKNLNMNYFEKPTSNLLESINKEKALEEIEDLEKKGAIHTIWTFVTPFIGAICNCTIEECIAMRTHYNIKVETFLRAEYMAQIDKTLCNGCGSCAKFCQFNAIDSIYESGIYFATINHNKCYGCGLCRKVCPTTAISLRSIYIK